MLGLDTRRPEILAPTPQSGPACCDVKFPSLSPQQDITEPENSSQLIFARPLWTEFLKSCSWVIELNSPAWLLKLIEMLLIVAQLSVLLHVRLPMFLRTHTTILFGMHVSWMLDE